jgi:hypothetical protein
MPLPLSWFGKCDPYAVLTWYVMSRPNVTRFVSLGAAWRHPRHAYLRQVEGRYCGFSVLPVQDQVMLPVWVVGDSSR